MNKRIFGMAPGGRMNLDRAANRRRAVRFSTAQRKTRKEAARPDTPGVCRYEDRADVGIGPYGGEMNDRAQP